MIKIVFKKSFEKKYKKLPNKIKLRIKERNILFVKNPNNPILNNHSLHGKYTGYRSINITGDIRVIYKFLDDGTVLFVEIGNHNDLYE